MHEPGRNVDDGRRCDRVLFAFFLRIELDFHVKVVHVPEVCPQEKQVFIAFVYTLAESKITVEKQALLKSSRSFPPLQSGTPLPASGKARGSATTGDSLGIQTRTASLVPQPLVFSVLSLTVAKADSMGLVVLTCVQCPARKS